MWTQEIASAGGCRSFYRDLPRRRHRGASASATRAGGWRWEPESASADFSPDLKQCRAYRESLLADAHIEQPDGFRRESLELECLVALVVAQLDRGRQRALSLVTGDTQLAHRELVIDAARLPHGF